MEEYRQVSPQVKTAKTRKAIEHNAARVTASKINSCKIWVLKKDKNITKDITS